MKIFGDYHTHTIYSHGKNDIIDNAKIAKEKGLKEIAITDHGFGHSLYAIKRTSLDEMKLKCRYAEIQTGVKIYLGVEANLLSLDGKIDIENSDLEKIDILLLGYHKFVKNSVKDKLKLFFPNLSKVKGKSQTQIKINTNALLRAMDKYPTDIIAHLNHGFKVNVEEIGKKAVETNTLIEINSSKKHLTEEEIKTLVKLGVNFIVNSDAHTSKDVGNVDYALEIIEKYNIPKKQIVNYGKLPEFTKNKNKRGKNEFCT